jgi:hypothetical protein
MRTWSGARLVLVLILVGFGALPTTAAVLATAAARHQDAQVELDDLLLARAERPAA